MNKENKPISRHIQSAGFINGEWKVIFDDGSILEDVVSIKLDKDSGRFGLIEIKTLKR